METEALSEETVMARTVVELLEGGVLNHDPRVVAKVSRVLKIPVFKIRDEWRSHDRWSRLAKVPDVLPRSEEPPPPAPEWSPPRPSNGRGGNHPYRANMREAKDGTLERRCCVCKEWFPATIRYFYVKDNATGRLSSYCNPCRISESRKRYLNVKAHASLAAVGLEYVITEADPELVCSTCGEPLTVGQEAYVDGAIFHKDCEH